MARRMRANGASRRPCEAVVWSSAIPPALSPETPPRRRIQRTGAQTVGKRHRQKRIEVPSVPAQPGLCQGFSAVELVLKTHTLLRVGFIFLPRGEDRVVLIELGFEYAQPIELRKQDARGFAYRSHGIVWVQFFPQLEFLLRARKIKIVEPVESGIESRRGQAGKRVGKSHQQNKHGCG